MSLISEYWSRAASAPGEPPVVVWVGRDTDLEAGFAPDISGTFETRAEAEAYVAKLQPLYDELLFWVG